MRRRSTVVGAITVATLAACGGLATSPGPHVEDAGGSTGSTTDAGSTRPGDDAPVADRSLAPGNGIEGGDVGDGSADRPVLTDSALDVGAGDAPAGNLIVNGDFSAGASHWGVAVDSDPVDGGVTNYTASGRLCVVFGPGASATLGWPSNPADALTLSAGTYDLSYEISSSAPLEVEARFGVDIAPYNDVNFDVFNMPETTLETFSNTFTITAEEQNAGLAFNFPGPGSEVTTSTTVCFANVSLVALSAPTTD
jgi:hypothetical protein